MKRMLLVVIVALGAMVSSCTHEISYKATIAKTGISVVVIDNEEDGQIFHTYNSGDTVLINNTTHRIGQGRTKAIIQNRL